MSVTPDDPARLPLHFRPISMGGAGALPVFALNLEMLGNDLSYRADPKKPSKHGFIEPAAPVHVEEYQRALARTAPAWLEVA